MIGHAISGDQLQSERKRYAFSAKNNATKEIESWGRDYGSLTGSMRSTGQLTDNVTEARLLQNRIMEMSRGRYKYITQADFNKKFFLASQQKKTKLMPQLLHGVDIQYWMSKKATRHVPTFSGTSNARFAFLDRLEKQGEKCKDFEEEEDENPFAMPARPKPPEQTQLPEFYRIRLKEQEEAELAKSTFPTQPLLRPSTQKAVAFCDKTDVKLPEVAQSVRSMPVTRQKSSPLSGPDRRAELLKRAQSSGVAGGRSVHDPRYLTLESSLSSKYTNPEEHNLERVQSIISSQDSLHAPSRITAKARPKLKKTILEYLRVRGFVV